MLDDLKKESTWVLLELDGVAYAVSCSRVLSLSQLPKVTPLPMSPVENRGVIDFRGHSIQLVDSKVMLSKKSTIKEIEQFGALMDQRRQDHVNWINTLKDCVVKDVEFTLTTDPHKCAFGKWYDSYQAKNTNIMFLSTFAKFDKPHKEIHEVADKAKTLIQSGRKDEAISLIKSVENTVLQQMLHLFEEIKEAFKESRKEIVLVLGEDENNCVGISVDRIIAIEHLFEIDEELIKESITDTEYLSGVGKRKDGSVVFLLNDEYIFNKFS